MCVKLGIYNPEEILQNLTAKQLQEWAIYAGMEPFDERRDDYRTASIEVMIANVHRDPKDKPYKISDFLLRFGDDQKPERKQTWQEQVAFLNLIAKVYSKEE